MLTRGYGFVIYLGIMTRQWRVEYKDALYHVLSRGNQQQSIFLDNTDRINFLEILEEMAERFNLKIYAFVLMSNHYHILLKTLEANLSKSMQWLGTTYTRRFNNRHHISGHLFQGRYKSINVQNDAYLLQLSFYIHFNPLRAKMVERLSDYEWSSYRYYAYKRKSPKWLTTSSLLNQFKNISDKHRAYRLKAQKYSDEKNKLLEDIRYGFIYGSKKFIKKIKDKYQSDPPDKELSQRTKMYLDINPDKIVRQAAKILICDIQKFKTSPRIRQSDKLKRDLLIYLLYQTGKINNKQIADCFGLSDSAISKRVSLLKKEFKRNNQLKGEYRKISSLIQV